MEKLRSMIVDFASTDPLYWDFSTRNLINSEKRLTLIISFGNSRLLYHSSWNLVQNQAVVKFLGLRTVQRIQKWYNRYLR